MKLNKDQEKALKKLNSNQNIFLTGGAGTGKTTLINYWKKNCQKEIPVVCSTGMAATLIPNAKTFHSFFGIGPLSPDQNVGMAISRASKRKDVIQRILQAEMIIIDEVSMISGFLFNCAGTIAKKIRQNSKPFGGIRIIAVGDFFQLPPVNENNKKPLDWVFKSKSWKTMGFETVELKEFMRTTELDFLNFLSNVRLGKISQTDKDFLNKRIFDENGQFEAMRLFPRKKEVQEYNRKKLAELPGKTVKIKTEYSANDDFNLERIKNNIPVDEELWLKIGAKVMIRSNCRKGSYANGTLGVVEEITEKYILVKKDKDSEVSKIYKMTYTLENSSGDIVAEAVAFPISKAYAVSIHKSQGQSIDRAVIDLRGLFESGQAYTALSRLTNSKGLKILGFEEKSFKIDKKVIKFYNK